MRATMKRGSKAVVFAAAVLPFAALVSRVVYRELNYLFNLILCGGDKTFLVGCVGLSDEEKVVENEESKGRAELEHWMKNVRHTDCYIRGYVNTPLYGRVFLQNRFTDKWAIVVHGYGGNGSMMSYAVKMFHDNGFNVVVPDLRCHGESGGKYIGMGWLDRLDILKWCDKIIKGNHSAQIVLYGVSMGAASVLMAAGEKIPDNIVCAVSDCSFDSVGGIMASQIKNVIKIPTLPIVAFFDMLCGKRAGYSIFKASVVKKVKNIKIPTMFIHGDNDNLVPVTMVYRLFENAHCKKDILVVHGAGHGVSAMVDKGLYWKRVFEFVKNAL
jgi:hypothetical protein